MANSIPVQISTTKTLLSTASGIRSVYNPGTINVYLGYGNLTTTNFLVMVAPGALYEEPVETGEPFYAISTATTTVNVGEF